MIDSRDARAAQAAVESNPVWYHSIELAPGVITPGHVDLRATAGRVLPHDLSGKRALDVGTFDGFWAFEMERRGAAVVAIDTPTADANDWPPLQRPNLEANAANMDLELGRGFAIAREALGSDAQRIPCNIYDLSPDVVGGHVNVVFIGAMLLHLRDPVAGLERVLDTLAPGGRVIILEAIAARTSLLFPRKAVAEFQTLTTAFNWWYPNVATLRAWLLTAGFTGVRRKSVHRQRGRKLLRQWTVAMEAHRPSNGS